MTKYYLQGGGTVELTGSDFKAQGGEGAIYVRGSTAYKVYTDATRMIPPAKVAELSVLNHPGIIRPEKILFDAKNRPAGYSMRHIDRAYALCRLFPQTFRLKNGVTPDVALRLVRALQEGVRQVHSKQILIVDLNEMNLLVSEDFKHLYFIDVDSYQTASFPATALMESVRDRHATRFSEGTDWFAFAVVSFQLFVGIHPYKGTHSPFQGIVDKAAKLDARMKANISVLHTGVAVPATCLPFDVIPKPYLDWYRAVLEDGKRMAPPERAQASTLVTAFGVRSQIASAHFDITEFREYDDEVIWFRDNLTLTERSLHVGGRRFAANAAYKVAITPRLDHVILATLHGEKILFKDLTSNLDIEVEMNCEELMSHQGRLYFKQGSVLAEVEFLEVSGAVIARPRPVGNVMKNSTQLFEGTAIQNLHGAFYVSLLPRAGACHQIRLSELDGYSIVDAKLSRNVLIVVAAMNGMFDKFIFRFGVEFRDYDVRVARDVIFSGINFTTLDNGLCLHLNESDELEIFSCSKDAQGIRVIDDPALPGDCRLFHLGKQALFARGNKLYRFSMRQ